MIDPFLFKTRISSSITQRLNSKVIQMNSSKLSMPDLPKPPNILLYSPGQSALSTKAATAHLESCLAPDRYTVYSINSISFNSEPWIENVKLLVIWASNHFMTEESNRRNLLNKMKEYQQEGGKVLCFNSNAFNSLSTYKVDVRLGDTLKVICSSELMQGTCLLERSHWSGLAVSDESNSCYRPLVKVGLESKLHAVAVGNGCTDKHDAIICMLQLLDRAPDDVSINILRYMLTNLGLECDNSPSADETEAVTLCENRALLFATSLNAQEEFLKCLDSQPEERFFSASGLTLLPVKDFTQQGNHPNFDGITAAYSTKSSNPFTDGLKCHFDWTSYLENLKAKKHGHVVVYADVISSTMVVFDGLITKLPRSTGVVAIARQQTKGQGRGGNKWLSPVGCAMFTCMVTVPMQSHLGHRLPFLQHLATVAAVQGIRTIPGLEDVDLRVKWPNDVYFGPKAKLGGVVVKSTMFKDNCIASIGCGINVANKKPTVCLNQILEEKHSFERKLTCEEVIARTLTCLEELIDDFQKNGPDSFLKLYYKYWLHSGADVQVRPKSQNSIDTTIVGVDDCGYLRVRRHDNGSILTLHPDGNSFDLTKNLVIAKR